MNFVSGRSQRYLPHPGFRLPSTPNGYARTMRIRKILVAIDGGPDAGDVLAAATAIACSPDLSATN